MPTRGSLSFVWFTDDLLGSGATGSVYRGRHKKQGWQCAVKVFAEDLRPGVMLAKARELELLKQLKHRNIATVLSIEQETHTKENVIVMELCSEGSVGDMVNKPDYRFGFPESEYLVFLHDFVNGLEYLREKGIIHRDIKPANILCTVDEYSRSIFKLTDFGSARHQNDEAENFLSLHGTEEYLHPDVYGSALMGARVERRGFGAATDLWSIGATLYHVATGQLPFQAYGGRNNKETMFRILSEKKLGDISGIQSEREGVVTWSRDLPNTCHLSSSLKKLVVRLIAGMMEKDPRHQWNFDQFFKFCHRLETLKRIFFYSGLQLQPCKLYLPDSATFADVQDELAGLTGVLATDQVWLHDTVDLLSRSSASSGLSEFPLTSEKNPIVVWSKPNRSGVVCKSDPVVSLVAPECNVESTNMSADATWSRDISAIIICYRRALSNLLQAQSVLPLVQESLCAESWNRFMEQRASFSRTQEMFRSIRLSCEILYGNLPQDGATLTLPNSDQIMIGKLQRLEHHIQTQFNLSSNISELREDRFKTLGQQISNCELRKCEAKFQMYVEKSKATYERFKSDKSRTLTYNEDQIHKYDKIKLNDLLKKSKKLLFEHCLPHTLDLSRRLLTWNSNQFRECYDHLIHIQKDVGKFKSVCSEVFASVEKTFESQPFADETASSLCPTSVPAPYPHAAQGKTASSAFKTFSASQGINDTLRSSGGMPTSELCPTPVKKLPVDILQVHLDLIRISQGDNLRIQKEIENRLKENDETLNRLHDMFVASSSAQ